MPTKAKQIPNPQSSTSRQLPNLCIRTISYSLVIGICLLIIPIFAHAAPTDPQSIATPVTATIPSTAVSGDTTPPTPPILLRPFDGTVTADAQPEFAWKTSTDPNGNTVIYTLYLDGQALFLGISNLGNSAGVGYTSRIEGGEVRLLPTILLKEGSHDWYVVASDLSGNQSSSTTWHFTVDTTPPPLTLIAVENFSHPTLSGDTTFDVQSPQEVDFIISSESYAVIQLTIVNSSGVTTTTISQTTDHTGIVYPYSYLSEGLYTVLISSTDRAGLTSVLPQFFLNLYTITIPLPSLPPVIRPPIHLPPHIVLPPPPSVPSLPATVAKLSTRDPLTLIVPTLLAIALLILLFIIWKRKYNLILVDREGSAIPYAEIYHSHPPHSGATHYILNNLKGRIYIPHLLRYSTLTIKYLDITLILSISRQMRRYTITI